MAKLRKLERTDEKKKIGRPFSKETPLDDLGQWDPSTCVMWLNLFSKEMETLYSKVLQGNKAAAQKMRVLTIYFNKVGKQFRRSSKLLPIEKSDNQPSKNVVIFKGMIDKLIL